ncbi:MAG: S8 family serine peptidase [Planctomycetota bacterium]
MERGSRIHKMLRIEELEPRTAPTGAVGVYDVSASLVSPVWFESLADPATPSGGSALSSTTETLDWNGQSVDVVAEQWIVQLTNQAVQGLKSVADTAGLLANGAATFDVLSGLGMAGQVLIRTSGMSAAAVSEWLSCNTNVAYFEPDRILTTSVIPNDPNFSQLWGLNSSTDRDIDAPEAWNVTTGSRGIVVGIIDTGVDYTHPDLAANIWTNPGETAGNGRDDDGNGFVDDVYGYDFANNDGNPMDDNSHGTHVAGTIGAVGNDGRGIVGVNWTTSIMALKFLDRNGSGSTQNAIRAINYATMMKTTYGVNIRLTNNSWGGGGYSQALYDAIAASGQAGMLFIAAAGNSGTNNDSSPNYPASYNLNNIISVAATNSSDQLASFSCYGATSVDLTAPGVSIYSTIPGGGYDTYDGTSMATPHVTGVAALAWSAAPSATATQIRDAILAGVDRITALNGKVATGGRLNAKGTLDRLNVGPPGNPTAQLTSAPPISSDATYYFDVTYRDDAAVDRSDIDGSDILVAGPNGYSQLATLYSTSPTGSDDRAEIVARYSLTAPGGSWDATDNGTYTVTMQANQVSDTSNNYVAAGSLGTFLVSFDTGGDGDAYEVDDTAAQAKVISTNGTTQVHSFHDEGDVDWVKFILSETSSVTLQTNGASGDTRMWLYGPNSSTTQIAFDDDSGSGYFSRIVREGINALGPGTYYVKVDEYWGNILDQYTLSVVAIPVGGGGGGDQYEDDDVAARASTIATDGTAQVHSFHDEGDVDWVKFTLTRASNVVIETNGSSGDTVLWLYNASGRQIGYDDDSGPGYFSRIAMSSLARGTYYVAVSEYWGDTLNQYSISVTAPKNVTPGHGLILDASSPIFQFRDADGDLVQVMFRGPGEALITTAEGGTPEDGMDIGAIDLRNTTEASSLMVRDMDPTRDSANTLTTGNTQTVGDGSMGAVTFIAPAGTIRDTNVVVVGNLGRAMVNGAVANSSINVSGDVSLLRFLNDVSGATVNVGGAVRTAQFLGGMSGTVFTGGGDVLLFMSRGDIGSGSSVNINGDVARFMGFGSVLGGSSVHVFGDSALFRIGGAITGGSTVAVDGAVRVGQIQGAGYEYGVASGSSVSFGSLANVLLVGGNLVGTLDISGSAGGSRILVNGDLSGSLLAGMFGDVMITRTFMGRIGDAETAAGVGNRLLIHTPGGGGQLAHESIFANRIGYP